MSQTTKIIPPVPQKSLIKENTPLYVITNRRLSSGQQTAQVGHCIADFAASAPNDFKEWRERSHYLVILETIDTETLEEVYNRITNFGFTGFKFHEPDLDNELTAICFSPDERLRKKLSNLPLAGKCCSKKPYSKHDNSDNNSVVE